jgi:hypothetical protein
MIIDKQGKAQYGFQSSAIHLNFITSSYWSEMHVLTEGSG